MIRVDFLSPNAGLELICSPFAAFVLMLWPLFAIGLCIALGRSLGLIVFVFAGYLFLPAMFSVDLPGVPSYNKEAAISLGIIICIAFLRPSRLELSDNAYGTNRIFSYCLAAVLTFYFLGPLGVYFTNQDTLLFGPREITSISASDLPDMIYQKVILIVPFLLGYLFLGTRKSQSQILQSLIVFGLLYSVLVLFERRLSPQLHNLVYGFFPHSFTQHTRGGGFRPMVFLGHGLLVGTFLLMVTLAAYSKARSGSAQSRYFNFLCGCWLLFVLLLSRNFGVAMLSFIFVPLLFTMIGIQRAFMLSISCLILIYPIVRQADLLPLDRFIESVSEVSPERAESFIFRIINEDMLLERAAERPLFGWGGYGRNRVYDENSGRNISVSDGLWIIVLGMEGWIGFLTKFGLLLLPLTWFALFHRHSNVPVSAYAFGIILSANLIDMLPNSSISPITMLIAGSLAGYLRLSNPEIRTQTIPKERVYTRFPPR